MSWKDRLFRRAGKHPAPPQTAQPASADVAPSLPEVPAIVSAPPAAATPQTAPEAGAAPTSATPESPAPADEPGPDLSQAPSGEAAPAVPIESETPPAAEAADEPAAAPAGDAAASSRDDADEAAAAPPATRNAPDTSALNAKIVQAVGFTNDQIAQYLPQLVQTPPEVMSTQTAGLAVQDAANYMNGIMQIALAAQAVIAKKAAEGPAEAALEVPVLLEMQKMVSAAVEVYGTVSQTAGTSAKTIIGDVSST